MENSATRKSFTKNDFFKNCMLIAVSSLCLKKNGVFQNVSVSRLTIQRRVADIGAKLADQLNLKVKVLFFNLLSKDGRYSFPVCAQHISKNTHLQLGTNMPNKISFFSQNLTDVLHLNWLNIPFVSIQKCSQNSNWR